MGGISRRKVPLPFAYANEFGMTWLISSLKEEKKAACAAPHQQLITLLPSFARPDGRGRPSPHGRLRAFRPPRQILFLLGSEAVDFDAHGFQLQLGYALVEFFGDTIDAFFQAAEIFDHVFDRERLVGETHVHDGRWMAFGGGQVDEPAFAEQINLPSIAKRIFFDELAGGALGG